VENSNNFVTCHRLDLEDDKHPKFHDIARFSPFLAKINIADDIGALLILLTNKQKPSFRPVMAFIVGCFISKL
jgi:hypothetical protein